jgi:hypothetical protein
LRPSQSLFHYRVHAYEKEEENFSNFRFLYIKFNGQVWSTFDGYNQNYSRKINERTLIWDGSSTSPKFSYFVDGTGTDGTKIGLYGYLKLDTYDTSGEIFDIVVETYDDNFYNMTNGVLGSHLRTIGEFIKRW